MADAPHPWTIIISTVSASLSVASICVSILAFQVNTSNTEISQRAYLTVDTPTVSYDKTGRLDKLEADVKNLGNTPGRNVRIT